MDAAVPASAAPVVVGVLIRLVFFLLATPAIAGVDPAAIHGRSRSAPAAKQTTDARPVNPHADLLRPAITDFAMDHNVVAELKLALRRLCDDPFMICYANRNNSAELDYMGGLYGVGVRAKLLNDPAKFGVEVYRNCPPDNPVNTAAAIMTPSCLLDPASVPSVEVFLKTSTPFVRKTDPIAVTYAKKRADAFDREVYRSRIAVSIRLPDIPGDVQVAPSVYDIRTTGPGGRPEFASDYAKAHIQEFIDGATALNVFVEIIKWERLYLGGQLRALSVRYGQYQRKKIDWATYRDAVVAAQKEIWGRHWSRYRFIDSLLYFSLSLWKQNLLHCDLHFRNLLFKWKIVSISEYNQIDALAELIPYSAADGQLHLFDVDTDGSDPQQGSTPKVAAFVLSPEHIRMVDNGFLLDLSGRPDMDAMPCLTSRKLAEEDLHALWRGGLQLSTFRNSTVDQNLVVNAFNAAEDSLHWNSSEWKTFYAERRQDADLVFKAVSVAEQELKSLQSHFLKIPEVNNCVTVQEADAGFPEAVSALRRGKKVSEALSLMKRKCSLTSQIEGVRKMRKVLVQFGARVPAMAEWGFRLSPEI